MLLKQVVRFFLRNPDEELTTGDIAVKFGSTIGAIAMKLSPGVNRGWLTRVRDKTGRGAQSTYSLGTNPPELDAKERSP